MTLLAPGLDAVAGLELALPEAHPALRGAEAAVAGSRHYPTSPTHQPTARGPDRPAEAS